MNAVLPRWINEISLKLALALGVSLLTVACAATDPQADATSADAAAAGTTTLAANEAAAADENKVECRNQPVTGSNLPRRVCRSVATWNALTRAERRMATEYSRQASEASGRVSEGNGGPVSPTATGVLGPGGY
jgi:hypothetical protein